MDTLNKNEKSRIANDLAQFSTLEKLSKEDLDSLAEFILEEKLITAREIIPPVFRFNPYGEFKIGPHPYEITGLWQEDGSWYKISAPYQLVPELIKLLNNCAKIKSL